MADSVVFVDSETLDRAILSLRGSANEFFRVWLTWKQMGFTDSSPVSLDTANSTPALNRLFGGTLSNGDLFTPFSMTPRWLKMAADASRSIIQTNSVRWMRSDSVVTCSPGQYVNFVEEPDRKVRVEASRAYPLGLGHGPDGFATADDARLAVPITAFAVWYGRSTPIPANEPVAEWLIDDMLKGLHISPAEKALVFVQDALSIATQQHCMVLDEIDKVCQRHLGGNTRAMEPVVLVEPAIDYSRRVRRMVSNLDKPKWLRDDPTEVFSQLLSDGATALLLYGPPRTGKTRIVDAAVPRASLSRATIQIHDGWGYDQLMQGFRPDSDEKWDWQDGPLKRAIEDGKTFVVLEEANRTVLTQALGEVFSLLESSYRGAENAVTLRSGADFSIPSDVVFVFTMNTLDRSTEDIDDALLGRVSAVACPPRASALLEILAAKGLASALVDDITKLFQAILDVYPLGHGYFAELPVGADNSQVVRYYVARIRSVLEIAMGESRRGDLEMIDNIVDELFGSSA